MQAKAIADRIAAASNVGAARLRETVGQYYLLSGDPEAALSQFEAAYQTRELGLFTVRSDRSTPQSLFAEPRWIALWRKPLMKKWQAAHDRVSHEIAEKGP